MYVVLCPWPAPAGKASQKYCALGEPSSRSCMSRSVKIKSEKSFLSSGKPLHKLPTTQHTPSGFAPFLHTLVQRI